MPSQNQISGLVRIAVPAVIAYASGAGWLHISGEESAALTDAIVNLIAGLIGFVMLVLSWRAASGPQILKSATELGPVKLIELQPTAEGRELASAVMLAPNPQATIIFTPHL